MVAWWLIFNLLYGKITAPHFAYLWTKQLGTFSFQVNEETQRRVMALKAIELSDSGIDVWHSVNPVYVRPTESKRGDKLVVSFQKAIVVDIDIRSATHKVSRLRFKSPITIANDSNAGTIS